MPRDKIQKRDLHALDEDGMVLCNPRDKEAAHRAQTEGIVTDNRKAVTCGKCILLIYKRNEALRGAERGQLKLFRCRCSGLRITQKKRNCTNNMN